MSTPQKPEATENRASQPSIVLGMLKSRGLVRPRDLAEQGISRSVLHRMTREGQIERVSPGLYSLPGALTSEHQSLIEACKRVPSGVICLLSALRFHEIGTQLPHEVWIAIHRKARRPSVAYPPLHIIRFSEAALTSGVEEHVIHGVTVKVTTPAKTVADCFKYRNKIGLDVALEALRESWQQRLITMDDLFRAARLGRVDRVIRPYAEAMV